MANVKNFAVNKETDGQTDRPKTICLNPFPNDKF